MNLVDALSRFNRKERYLLIRNALGPSSARLGEAFRDKLEAAINIEVPCDAWWAMDYHLDWLVGALSLVSNEADAHQVRPNTDGMVTGTQEDMDLVVAFGDVLVLVEAKGETSWVNEQFKRKVNRLEGLRRAELLPGPKDLRVFFVVMSPRAPSDRLSPELGNEWESWMCNAEGRPVHVPLEMPGEFWKVTRWDDRLARPAAVDTHWKIVPARGATKLDER
ncbi:hypothetical protein [Ideonella sp. A 288]|uniref:hypothetical protein n=1 Tax=Ideonella sp. A 288 TaxID=1962181 RepID=UPI000B4ACE3A|nr:hypothetical protein [Ideonella sp. A 288]